MKRDTLFYLILMVMISPRINKINYILFWRDIIIISDNGKIWTDDVYFFSNCEFLLLYPEKQLGFIHFVVVI